MNWLSSLFTGVPASESQPKEEPKSTQSHLSVEERQALLLKTQRLQLKKNKAHLESINADLQKAIDDGDQAEAKRLLTRTRVIKQEIATLEGQIANQEAAQRTLASAQTNTEQALLMRDGANQLARHVDEAERIDVDDIVDTFQDGAQRTHELSSRLSEPIVSMSLYALNEEGEDVDEEVARLMQRSADAKAASLPSAGNGGGGGTVVAPMIPRLSGAGDQSRLVPAQKSLDAIKEKDY